MCQRRAFRRFSESPKHPIDCRTSFAKPRELVHRSPPVPSSPLSLPRFTANAATACWLLLLLLSFPPSTFSRSLAALGMANTPPCRGYVSRMRPPPPAAIHPSFLPPFCVMLAVVPASMAANSYNLLLFSSLDLSSLFFYNAINFSFFSSLFFRYRRHHHRFRCYLPLLLLQRFNLLLFRQLFSPPPTRLYLSTISRLPAGGTRCIRVRVAFYSLSLSRYRYHFSPTHPL